MKAVQIQEFGHTDKIQINDIPIPGVGVGQVLVEVHAASINPFDTKVREGQAAPTLQLPVTLGGDIAGIVTDIGDGVQNVSRGDHVYGQANVVAGNSGAFAEFALTKADQLAKMPTNIDFEQAAALPLTAVSALQVIVRQMNLQAGQKILIHGGAGGIGTIAIQIAKHIGAYVATTATGDGLAYVKQLGADEAIDYMSQKFENMLHDFDAVFDTVGGENYTRSFQVLKPGGILVSMITQPVEQLMQQYSVRAVMQFTKVNTADLTAVAELVEKGVITPHVDNAYPLEKVAEAFEARESGKVKGKVVLTIAH